MPLSATSPASSQAAAWQEHPGVGEREQDFAGLRVRGDPRRQVDDAAVHVAVAHDEPPHRDAGMDLRQAGIRDLRDQLANGSDRAVAGPESEQHAVAELLDDAPAVIRDHAARDEMESCGVVRGPLVAARHRELRVPRQVDERDRPAGRSVAAGPARPSRPLAP